MTRELRRRARELADWLDARPTRERAFLLAAALVVLAAAWSTLLMDPLAERRVGVEAETRRLETELRKLETQGEEILEAHESDPNAALRERAEALNGQIQSLDERIREHTVTMISPAEMARFLEELLAEQTDLRLVRLENLGAEPVLEGLGLEEDDEAPQTGVFKHAFEVVLRGRYLSTLHYLRALESLPWNFFWETLAYEVHEYPQGQATIRAYTLSGTEEWIGV